MTKRKPWPLWVGLLVLTLEVLGIAALLYGIWHNVKCALGVH